MFRTKENKGSEDLSNDNVPTILLQTSKRKSKIATDWIFSADLGLDLDLVSVRSIYVYLHS